jgi:hypothetical protein
MPRINRSLTISASEVGEYLYCAKSWYLKRCGEKPQSEAIDQGSAFHKHHAVSVSQAENLKRAGRVVIILAAILALILVVLIALLYTTGGAN